MPEDNLIVLDANCRSGSGLIRLAQRNISLAIGIDEQPHYLMNARINSSIYGVVKKIEFICGDFRILKKIKADVVYYHPNIEKSPEILINKTRSYLQSAIQICQNIILVLPSILSSTEVANLCGAALRKYKMY